MMKRLLMVTATVGAVAGGCSSTLSTPMQEPPSSPYTIIFDLHNDGAQPVYLFQGCILKYTITALADPVHEIARADGCACTCGLTCGTCGACAQTSYEVAAGMAYNDTWTAVSFTTETNSSSLGGGSCIREHALPPGSYRIDVPVYATFEDATAGTGARTATQTFALPAPDGHVAVALGVSP